MMNPLYKHIAGALIAIENCQKDGNNEWLIKHNLRLDHIEQNHLPSGSGIDCGTKIDRTKSRENRIVLTTSFHHMNEGGVYDGWTEHDVIITPDLFFNFDVRVTGRDRNDIKDYLGAVYSTALCEEIDDLTLYEGVAA